MRILLTLAALYIFTATPVRAHNGCDFPDNQPLDPKITWTAPLVDCYFHRPAGARRPNANRKDTTPHHRMVIPPRKR